MARKAKASVNQRSPHVGSYYTLPYYLNLWKWRCFFGPSAVVSCSLVNTIPGMVYNCTRYVLKTSYPLLSKRLLFLNARCSPRYALGFRDYHDKSGAWNPSAGPETNSKNVAKVRNCSAGLGAEGKNCKNHNKKCSEMTDSSRGPLLCDLDLLWSWGVLVGPSTAVPCFLLYGTVQHTAASGMVCNDGYNRHRAPRRLV